MSTRRARQHQWIVLRQKAFRRLKRQRGIYRTEPLGLLQFVKAPFDPDPFEPFWVTKEDKHD